MLHQPAVLHMVTPAQSAVAAVPPPHRHAFTPHLANDMSSAQGLQWPGTAASEATHLGQSKTPSLSLHNGTAGADAAFECADARSVALTARSHAAEGLQPQGPRYVQHDCAMPDQAATIMLSTDNSPAAEMSQECEKALSLSTESIKHGCQAFDAASDSSMHGTPGSTQQSLPSDKTVQEGIVTVLASPALLGLGNYGSDSDIDG